MWRVSLMILLGCAALFLHHFITAMLVFTAGAWLIGKD
jgi:hypothetical protein